MRVFGNNWVHRGFCTGWCAGRFYHTGCQGKVVTSCGLFGCKYRHFLRLNVTFPCCLLVNHFHEWLWILGPLANFARQLLVICLKMIQINYREPQIFSDFRTFHSSDNRRTALKTLTFVVILQYIKLAARFTPSFPLFDLSASWIWLPVKLCLHLKMAVF